MNRFFVAFFVIFLLSSAQIVNALENKAGLVPDPKLVQVSESPSPSPENIKNSEPTSESTALIPSPSPVPTGLDWSDTPDTGRDREFSRKMQQRIVLTIVALIVISVLIYFVIKYLSSNKVNIPFLGLGQQSAMIKVVDRHMLAPNRALYLVNVAGKHVLLGSAENSLSFLCDVPDDDMKKFDDKKKTAEKAKPEKAPFDFFSEDEKS